MADFDSLQFDWDDDKARRYLREHGVSFQEAESVFRDPLAAVYQDKRHSVSEERYFLLGQSSSGRFVLVVYSLRRTIIRIISARRPTRREQYVYEHPSS